MDKGPKPRDIIVCDHETSPDLTPFLKEKTQEYLLIRDAGVSRKKEATHDNNIFIYSFIILFQTLTWFNAVSREKSNSRNKIAVIISTS